MTFVTRLLQLFEGVLIAFDAIRANKVRAALTILGIAVGVFVVTAISAAVHGINARRREGDRARGADDVLRHQVARLSSTAATAPRTLPVAPQSRRSRMEEAEAIARAAVGASRRSRT